MKITKTYGWNRRDFYFDAECEHCGNVEKNNGGYDDNNYYQNVVPNKKCKSCGESSLSKPTNELQTICVPKYDSNLIL